jgi:hypothetical protein
MARGTSPTPAGGARQRLSQQFDAADHTGTKPTLQSVYAGRQLIGFLLDRGKLGVEATDARNRSLGIYTTPKAAAAADAISTASIADAASRALPPGGNPAATAPHEQFLNFCPAYRDGRLPSFQLRRRRSVGGQP